MGKTRPVNQIPLFRLVLVLLYTCLDVNIQVCTVHQARTAYGLASICTAPKEHN